MVLTMSAPNAYDVALRGAAAIPVPKLGRLSAILCIDDHWLRSSYRAAGRATFRAGALGVLLASLPTPSVAAGGDVLVSDGARYLVQTFANPTTNKWMDSQTSFYLVASDPPGKTIALSEDDRLERSDELVRAILRYAKVDPRKIDFARDRFLPGQHQSMVTYVQRHQRYPIVSAGARLILDQNGRIARAYLTYDTRELPTFAPKDSLDLRKIALRAVPFPPVDDTWRPTLAIDLMNGGPARLFYNATFEVRKQGEERPWRVCIDAVTGEVIDSSDDMKY